MDVGDGVDGRALGDVDVQILHAERQEGALAVRIRLSRHRQYHDCCRLQSSENLPICLLLGLELCLHNRLVESAVVAVVVLLLLHCLDGDGHDEVAVGLLVVLPGLDLEPLHRLFEQTMV